MYQGRLICHHTKTYKILATVTYNSEKDIINADAPQP